jgi:hypothetical protein
MVRHTHIARDGVMAFGRGGEPPGVRARLRTGLVAFVPLLVLVAVVALVAGCSLGGGSADLPGIGEPAGNDTVSVTLHSLTFYDAVTSELGVEITPKSDEDVFAIADLTVRNTGSEALQVDAE